jgi:NADH-quinone oxidoreductase subunit H
VKAQQAQHVWFAFKFFPIGLVGLFIFGVAMIAETNRAPFDLPEAESELVAGFHTEYSGFRWSIFFLAEYAAMIAVSSIAVTLWLGGWLRPFPNLLTGETWDTVFSLFPAIAVFGVAALTLFSAARMPKILGIQKMGLGAVGVLLLIVAGVLAIPQVRNTIQDIFWFAAKVAVFMYLYIWYRGTFPRYRFDQLMKLGWKVMIPMGIAVLVLVALFPIVRLNW